MPCVTRWKWLSPELSSAFQCNALSPLLQHSRYVFIVKHPSSCRSLIYHPEFRTVDHASSMQHVQCTVYSERLKYCAFLRVCVGLPYVATMISHLRSYSCKFSVARNDPRLDPVHFQSSGVVSSSLYDILMLDVFYGA